jgi:hypothetical protein
MNRIKAVGFLAALISIIPLRISAEVDTESLFFQARIPASQLDLVLYDIEKDWEQRYVKAPEPSCPLIYQAGVDIDLKYFGKDRIRATGWITRLDGFLNLSAGQRKQLVFDTLKLLHSSIAGRGISLVDKKSGEFNGKMFEKHHISLTMIIGPIAVDEKGQNIRFILPTITTGLCQAGYNNRQFVFSESYFLSLRVNNSRAVSGDPNKFIIEGEK